VTVTVTGAAASVSQFAAVVVCSDGSYNASNGSGGWYPNNARDLGFTDREIVDIALAAAARNYYSRAIQALAVDVEVPPQLSPQLRDALVGGL